jgi:hypothetical protein
MSTEHRTPARRGWDLSWRAARELPEGPVTLWMAVFSDARQLLGSAPATGLPSWLWRDGRLSIDYGTVHVGVLAEGRYQTAFIIAVSGGRYVPVFRIGLGKPQLVRPGTTMTILDGRITLTPDADFDAFQAEL